MKNLILLIVSMLLLVLSCKKDNAVLANCQSIADADILSETERQSECIFRNVYRYRGEIYTMLICCSCNQVPMVFDCNGEPLCAFDQNCMEDFAVDAEFLFTVSGR